MKAIEAAARALAMSKSTPDDYGSDEEEDGVIDFIWIAYVPEVTAVIRAYLAALAEDDAAVEAVARALCSDPDQIIYRRTGPDAFEELGPRWKVEHAEDARAAIRAMGGE